MCAFIAQLVEHRSGIAEVMGSNPVEALIFFRLLLSNCLNLKKNYCDDHTSLSKYEVRRVLVNTADRLCTMAQSSLEGPLENICFLPSGLHKLG